MVTVFVVAMFMIALLAVTVFTITVFVVALFTVTTLMIAMAAAVMMAVPTFVMRFGVVFRMGHNRQGKAERRSKKQCFFHFINILLT